MQRATLAKVPSQSQCDVTRIALSGPADINREGGDENRPLSCHFLQKELFLQWKFSS